MSEIIKWVGAYYYPKVKKGSFSFREGEYNGEKTIKVYRNGKQVGNIAKKIHYDLHEAFYNAKGLKWCIKNINFNDHFIVVEKIRNKGSNGGFLQIKILPKGFIFDIMKE